MKRPTSRPFAARCAAEPRWSHRSAGDPARRHGRIGTARWHGAYSASPGRGADERCAGGPERRHCGRMIRKLIDNATLIGELEATTKDAALKELLAAAQAAGAFPAKAAKSLAKRLSEREAIGSTGLGNSVAV